MVRRLDSRRLPALVFATLAAAGLLAGTAARATPIVDIVAENLGTISSSSVDVGQDGTLTRFREFRAGVVSTSAVSVFGSQASFEHHFGWMAAVLSGAGAPLTGNSAGGTVKFDVTFTVEDPNNIGYTLGAGARVKGRRIAHLVSAAGPVQAAGTSLGSVRLLADGIAVHRSGPSTGGITRASANSSPFDSTDIYREATFDFGSFTGTRTFRIQVDNNPSPGNVSALISNGEQGEAAVLFGLAPTLEGFVHAGSPRDDVSDLGYFLTVTATFDEPIAVPEPAALALLAGAALMAAAGALRRRSL